MGKKVFIVQWPSKHYEMVSKFYNIYNSKTKETRCCQQLLTFNTKDEAVAYSEKIAGGKYLKVCEFHVEDLTIEVSNHP